jgi:hypothetical protein
MLWPNVVFEKESIRVNTNEIQNPKEKNDVQPTYGLLGAKGSKGKAEPAKK